jgi:hypothetical protein
MHQMNKGKLSIPGDSPRIDTGPEHGPGWGPAVGPPRIEQDAPEVVAPKEFDVVVAQAEPPVDPTVDPLIEDVTFEPQAYEESPIDYEAEDRELEALVQDETIETIPDRDDDDDDDIEDAEGAVANITMTRAELEALADSLQIKLPKGRWNTKKVVGILNKSQKV